MPHTNFSIRILIKESNVRTSKTGANYYRRPPEIETGRIMQEGIFIKPQEAMEPVLNEALIDYESSLWLKAVKIKLSFPQQIVEEHEHVRDANQLGARHDLHRPRTTHKCLQEARS